MGLLGVGVLASEGCEGWGAFGCLRGLKVRASGLCREGLQISVRLRLKDLRLFSLGGV